MLAMIGDAYLECKEYKKAESIFKDLLQLKKQSKAQKKVRWKYFYTYCHVVAKYSRCLFPIYGEDILLHFLLYILHRTPYAVHRAPHTVHSAS